MNDVEMSSSSQLTIELDKDTQEPIYRQLIRLIREQIDSGELENGTRLPASRDLALQLSISRISVVNAYAELRAEGYLSTHTGRGTFVSVPNNLPNRAYAPNATEPHQDQHAFRDLMRLAYKPNVINFSHGTPPGDFYPVQQLHSVINRVIERDGAAALGYEPPEGYGPLRAAVRDYVNSWGIQCLPAQVLVTGGTQQGLNLAVRSILAPGDTLVTSNPTYLGMRDIAFSCGVRLHGVDMDEDGMSLLALEEYASTHDVKLVYVMPSFHNPTGLVMPLHRRRQLLQLAEQYDFTILEDGVYQEFQFEGESVSPLKALDEHDRVIFVSGFTKSMVPGLRIGYMISTLKHYESIARIKAAADISSPGLNQRAMHLMLKHGIAAQQLDLNLQKLRRRRDMALRAAETYLPEGSTWSKPIGGLYLWVELPHHGPTAAELYVTAIQNGVAFAIGNVFYTNDGGTYQVRLNYALQDEASIPEGIARLGRAWQIAHDEGYGETHSPIL